MKFLVENHIPMLESALSRKKVECNQLSLMVATRDEIIAQKAQVSKMKDDVLEEVRLENSKLKNQLEYFSRLNLQLNEDELMQLRNENSRLKNQIEQFAECTNEKDDELKRLRYEVSQLKHQIDQLTEIHSQMENIHCVDSYEKQSDSKCTLASILENQLSNSHQTANEIDFEDRIQSIDVDPQSTYVQNDDSAILPSLSHKENKSQQFVAVNEHNYSRKKISRFECEDCGYVTNRSNTLLTHREETCKIRRRNGLLSEKDKQCKFCLKQMRHNALRAHLKHFIKALKAKKILKGKHALIKLGEFEEYLKEIKKK